jgi:hypothetical protein
MTMNVSPLFNLIEKDEFNELRVQYSEPTIDVTTLTPEQITAALFNPNTEGLTRKLTGVPGNRLQIVPLPVNVSQAHAVDSVAAAEDEIMALALAEAKVFDLDMVGPDKVGHDPARIADHYAALSIMINRSANIIAARTRRGAGNIVLVSPKGLDVLAGASISAFARTSSSVEDSETFGRWTAVGYINSSMRVFVSDEMDADTVIVAYVGTPGDGPGELFKTDDGYALHIRDNHPDSLGNAHDYIQRITLRNV